MIVFNSHHRVNQVVNFAQDGVKAANDKEILKIACTHFEKVYNRVSSFDPTAIDDVLQRPEDLDHNQLPTIEELTRQSLTWPHWLHRGNRASLQWQCANGSQSCPTRHHSPLLERP
jgi:hypothetical protein